MNEAPQGPRPGYPVPMTALILIVVGVAAASLFVATGGSLLGRGPGIFGIGGDREAVAATLRLARQEARQGEYERALARFDTVVSVLPEDRRLAVERAQVLGWAQRYGEAADALAAVEDPADVETLMERARYLWWAGRPLEADRVLSAVLARHPELAEARELQALVRPSVEPDVAVARRWLQERPDDPFARLWLARALVQSGDLASALTNYRQVASEDAAVEPDVLLEAAGVALALDSLAEASEYFRRYLDDVDPTDTVTRLRLARAYRWSGRWTAAEAEYRAVLAAEEAPAVRLELARMLAIAGRYDAAAGEYLQVLALRPTAPVRRELAMALARQGRYGAALREMALALGPTPDPDALLAKAELLALLERYGEAADALGEVLEQRPQASGLRLERSRYLWWAGRLDEADEELTRLLASGAGDTEAKELLETIREGIDPSVEQAKRWLALEDTPRYRLLLARTLVADERYGEALPHYRVALEDTATRALVLEAAGAAEAADSLDTALSFLEAWGADESDPELLLRRARLVAWASRPAEAAALYGRYLAAVPADTAARFERAQQLAWQDSTAWDSATAELERVLAAAPEHGGALKLLGDLNRWQGRPDEALAYYRRAQAVAPDQDGLDEGIDAAQALAKANAPRDPNHIPWTLSVDAFHDSEAFGWIASDARRSWKLDRATTLGLQVGQRYGSGQALGGLHDGAVGLDASLVGRLRFTPHVTAEVAAGVSSYATVGQFATWAASAEYSDPAVFVRLLYEHTPAVREATTMAALLAETSLNRLLLRTRYGSGAWLAAADVQLQSFRADAGTTNRYAGMFRVDRAVGTSGWRAGTLVRAIFATELAPTYPDWGPLLWAPVRYVAPALSVSYGAPVGQHWWLGFRANPGYAFIEERASGLARYPSGETVILETGGTVGYTSGPWSFGLSGDWGGALPDGYRASVLRLDVSWIGGIP